MNSNLVAWQIALCPSPTHRKTVQKLHVKPWGLNFEESAEETQKTSSVKINAKQTHQWISIFSCTFSIAHNFGRNTKPLQEWIWWVRWLYHQERLGSHVDYNSCKSRRDWLFETKFGWPPREVEIYLRNSSQMPRLTTDVKSLALEMFCRVFSFEFSLCQ